MKRTDDPRHLARRRAIQALFQYSFLVRPPKEKLAGMVADKIKKIDEDIRNSAPEWPIEKIAKVDLAILRLAVYELNFSKTPPKVAIDEAVELAKEFGAETSPGFVNGVLASLLEKQKSTEIG